MPSRDLKAALIPLDIKAYDSEANLRAATERITGLDPDTDLAVLPEMFDTGFSPDPAQLAVNGQPDNGPLITSLRELAEKRGIGIWGGFTAFDGGNYFNRGFMIDDNGEAGFYDKRHLFSYGGESDVLTPGSRLSPIVEFRSWKLKMSICYDIRFPVWNRSHANDYDALIVPANWAHARYYAWKHLLIARAIENQAYVLGCNREGHDLYGTYMRGDSGAYSYWGTDISDRRDDGTVYAILKADEINRDRSRFAPWRDADDFKLIID